VKGPKKRIVCGAVQFDDWTKKLDEILSDHLISQKLDQITSVLEEHRRRGMGGGNHDKIEAALSLARALLKSGQRTAANNTLFELDRLCADSDASLLKPHLERGLQFRGRGKTRGELSQQIARVVQKLGRSTVDLERHP
jgi:hypothetical protein